MNTWMKREFEFEEDQPFPCARSWTQPFEWTRTSTALKSSSTANDARPLPPAPVNINIADVVLSLNKNEDQVVLAYASESIQRTFDEYVFMYISYSGVLKKEST